MPFGLCILYTPKYFLRATLLRYIFHLFESGWIGGEIVVIRKQMKNLPLFQTRPVIVYNVYSIRYLHMIC